MRPLTEPDRNLGESERQLLLLLAVLPAGLPDECVEQRALLATLCRHSLVALQEGRFRARESARRAALRGATEAERTRAYRDAAHTILLYAESWAAGAEGSTPAASLDRLASELENLTLLHARLASSEPALSVRSALVLEPLLRARGPRDLHLRLLASAAEIAREVDPGLSCDVQLMRAEALANTYGDPGRALGELDTLDTAHLRGAREARKHWLEGICAFARARYADAERLVSAARIAFEAVGDIAGEACALNTLGNVLAHQGRFEEAETSYRASLARHAQTAELRKRAVVLQNLARLASESGAHERAAALHDRALELSRQLGDSRVEAMGFTQSALAAHDRGELETAAQRYETAMQLFAQTGEWRFRGFAQVLSALCAIERRELTVARGAIASCEPHDPLTAGLRAAVGAVIAADSGEHEAAAAGFAAARAGVRGDPHLGATVHVLEGLLNAAGAELRRRTGRDADADALASAARARVASVVSDVCPARPLAERSCLVRIAVRLLRGALGDRGRVQDLMPSLELGHEATWFRLSGEPQVDLARRLALRRLLAYLVARRLEAPNVPAKAAELVNAGWPGERIEKRAALNRLYVAIATLRSAGLGGALITRHDGYMLDPNLPIVSRPTLRP